MKSTESAMVNTHARTHTNTHTCRMAHALKKMEKKRSVNIPRIKLTYCRRENQRHPKRNRKV